jgi:uncharacterized membrane protein
VRDEIYSSAIEAFVKRCLGEIAAKLFGAAGYFMPDGSMAGVQQDLYNQQGARVYGSRAEQIFESLPEPERRELAQLVKDVQTKEFWEKMDQDLRREVELYQSRTFESYQKVAESLPESRKKELENKVERAMSASGFSKRLSERMSFHVEKFERQVELRAHATTTTEHSKKHYQCELIRPSLDRRTSPRPH